MEPHGYYNLSQPFPYCQETESWSSNLHLPEALKATIFKWLLKRSCHSGKVKLCNMYK